MLSNKEHISPGQEFFQTMVTGVLLYSVVLGFFNDYTDILHTGTYSITFSVAIVMQILTYLTFKVKDIVVERYANRSGKHAKAQVAFFIWVVMFFSKFVFLGVIGAVFRQTVEISGFIGLIVIIACLTLAQKLLEIIYKSLGQ